MVDKQRIGTFVIGGIAGALAGILLAPKSGKELRGSIANRAGEARERSRETYFEARERMQERITEVRERTPHREEYRTVQTVAPPLPKLGSDTPGPSVETSVEPAVEAPAESSSPPSLRDVSRDATRPVSGEEPDPEEIRRKIQETRSRLRERLDSFGERDE
jgi:gas vesicle protein